ncbi:MAG: AMP-binding protein [Candidatus Alcyoniella australis]|nr:AMP-binding protein [Candidatus Alcyoniella australis]
MNLVDLLNERARKYADKTFLFFEESTTSYGQLNRSTSSVAAGLGNMGVAHGDRVALLLPNCPQFVQSFLGIMRLGAVAVPLNTHLKHDEIRNIVQHCGARTLIVHHTRVERVRSLLERELIDNLVVVGSLDVAGGRAFSELTSCTPCKDSTDVGDDDLAAILYATASSRHQRGVMLSHANYTVNAAQTAVGVQMREQDRLLCMLPLYNVNAQVVTLLAPLYAGASVLLVPKFRAHDFLPALSKHKVTAFSAVPTVYAILNKLRDTRRYDLRSLRYCISGAAPLPVDVLHGFESRFGATIIEGYGLSEATCTASVNPLDSTRKIGSVGLPVPDQQMRIVDRQGDPIPPGRIGEIQIKGPNVMLGYYNDPQATAETIVEGWMHTGDVGYCDRDGFFFIVGRARELIIRGGQNIFPREVVEALENDERVIETAVIGAPDEIYGEQVVAFVVLKPDCRADEQSIIERCLGPLAGYKCPTRVLFVEKLPRDSHGKLNKQSLMERFLNSI